MKPHVVSENHGVVHAQGRFSAPAPERRRLINVDRARRALPIAHAAPPRISCAGTPLAPVPRPWRHPAVVGHKGVAVEVQRRVL